MDPTQEDIRHHYETFPFPSGSTLPLTQHWTDLIERFLQEKKITSTENQFLDAGCGTGDNLLSFAEEFPNFQFTGIDQSSNSIGIANKKLQNLKKGNVEFIHEMILDHHPDHPYVLISCLGVIHHCADPKRNLKHLFEILKPGGYLLLDVYGFYGYLLTQRTQGAINLLEPDFSKIPQRKKAMEWIASEILGLSVPADSTHPRYVGLADGFLVPTAYSYRVGEIINQLVELGFQDVQWWDCPEMAGGKVSYKTFRGEVFQKSVPKHYEEALIRMSPLKRYEFFELIFAPFDYFLVGQKQT